MAAATPAAPPPAVTTIRARVRAEVTQEIKDTARRQMADVGSSALSLRAVAREVGMVSSAVYRYFPSRDALLTALIIDAYESVAVVAEGAATDKRGGVTARWLRITRAIRGWALAKPHDYALIYGSPVPGYRAPEDTIPPALRVSLVALDLVRDGVADGEITTDDSLTAPRPVHADFTNMRDELAPDVSDDVLSRALMVWTQMFGTISFELFGHLHNVIHDYDAFFDHQMRQAGALLVTGVRA
jgi:AcrR family transcriptional regulator